MIITLETLRQNSSCGDEDYQFKKHFPNGIDISPLFLGTLEEKGALWNELLVHKWLRRQLHWAAAHGLTPSQMYGNYSGSDLSHMRLGQMSVEGLDFRNSRAYASYWTTVDAVNNQFDGANLGSSHWYKSFISRNTFTKTRLHQSTFRNCHFVRNSFSRADLDEVTFTRCVFSDTRFADASVCWARFIDCHFYRTNFAEVSTIDKARFETCTADACCRWPDDTLPEGVLPLNK